MDGATINMTNIDQPKFCLRTRSPFVANVIEIMGWNGATQILRQPRFGGYRKGPADFDSC